MRKRNHAGGARLALRVRAALTRCGIGKLDTLLVGFSGGVDSLALALCVKELGIPAVLAHLDHGLRAESTAQVEAVRQLAERIGLPLQTTFVNVAALSRELGTGIEDAGRRARYAFFAEVRQKLAAHGRAWIALGHQADDLAEDVLLRLVRGAGWPALGGMCEVDAARWLVRPLLYVPKADLKTWVAANSLSPVEDDSNASLCFRRNRLRHTVLPLLQAENPALSQAIRRLHEQARLDEDYWETQLAPVLAHVRCTQDRVQVPESLLRPLHPALRQRIFRRLLALLPGAGQARADTLSALERAFLNEQRPKVFQFSEKTQAILANGSLQLMRL